MKRFGTLALCAAFSLMFMGTWLPTQAQDTPKATAKATAKATDKTKKTPGFIQKLADEGDTLGSAKKVVNAARLEGDRAYKAENYFFAIEHYKNALRFDKKDKEVPFLIAECYRMANEIKNADPWYAKALKMGYANESIYIQYGTILRALERYPEAIDQYEAYLRLRPEEPYIKWLIESCRLAQTWLEKPARYTVENIKRFNTKNSEFGIAPMKTNAILLSSTRPEAMGTKLYGRLGEDFSDLFESYVDGQGKWTKLRPVPGLINTTGNEGTPSLTTDGNTMYFTRCNVKKGVCRLFKTTREITGWSEPEPISIFGDTVDVGHPSISVNEDKLYFVANNAEGGYGGRDIWFMNRTQDDTWEEPVNLGSTVNTERDEMFPFIHASDTILFFASDGHPGMGGLDIFRSSGGGSDWEQAQNMRNPINSGADDFGFTANPKLRNGFLVSSRLEGRGSDDIYLWNFVPYRLSLKGQVIDDTTRKPLPGAVVRLLLEDSTYYETETDSQGAYSFKIREDVRYVLEASVSRSKIPAGLHAGPAQRLLYYPTDTSFDTYQTRDDIDWVIDLPMKLVPTEEFLLTDILYDYDSSRLRPVSMVALDSLVRFLNKSPNISIAINSHTDSRGSDGYNRKLSQRRAQSVVDYLRSQGIDSTRLKAIGYGETRLLNRCKDKVRCTEQEHQVNRRTTFSITSIDLDRVIVKYRRVTGEETESTEETLYTAISEKPRPVRPAARP